MRRLALLAAAAMFASGVHAQEAGSRQTRDFVDAAAQSDAFEMLEAESALTESRDPQVRAFATQMIQDHLASSRQIQAAAAGAGLRPPPLQVGDDQAHLLYGLQGLRGPDFARTYARQQALAHASALATMQLYAANGDDPGLRQAADRIVPMISAHLAAAERLRAALGSH